MLMVAYSTYHRRRLYLQKNASSDSILTSDVCIRVGAALRRHNAAQRHQALPEQSVLRQWHVFQFVQTQALTHAQVRVKRTRRRLHQVGACATMGAFRARNEPVHVEVRVELQKRGSCTITTSQFRFRNPQISRSLIRYLLFRGYTRIHYPRFLVLPSILEFLISRHSVFRGP